MDRVDTEHLAANRIRSLADLLLRLSTAMGEQSEFHESEMVGYGIISLQGAARLGARRAASADKGGTRSLKEMEKTLLCELERAVDLSGAVLTEADINAWPDLHSAAIAARTAIRAAVARDPALFAPAWVGGHERGSEPSAFTEPSGWRSSEDFHYLFAPDGVPLWVMPHGEADQGRWIAKVGLVGVAMCATPHAAAERAIRAHQAIFGISA